jgi:hypothetical protein
MDPKRTDDDDRTPSSPYGPQPDGVDEASGGADSSPYENASSDARDELADDEATAPDTDDEEGEDDDE